MNRVDRKLEVCHRCWRTQAKAGYLFPERALARVFRDKLCERLIEAGIPVYGARNKSWVVDCQSVGRGDHAITYLGRYLYRGVVREKDIVAMDNESVTYAYTDNQGCRQTRCVKGEAFLWQVIQHTLPKGFRRVRNYGYLHPNSRTMVQVIQCLLLRVGLLGPAAQSARPTIHCAKCGSARVVVTTGLSLSAIKQNTEPLKQVLAPVM